MVRYMIIEEITKNQSDAFNDWYKMKIVKLAQFFISRQENEKVSVYEKRIQINKNLVDPAMIRSIPKPKNIQLSLPGMRS